LQVQFLRDYGLTNLEIQDNHLKPATT